MRNCIKYAQQCPNGIFEKPGDNGTLFSYVDLPSILWYIIVNKVEWNWLEISVFSTCDAPSTSHQHYIYVGWGDNYQQYFEDKKQEQ